MSVSGKVESKSKKGTGIKVGGQWYNGSSQLLAEVNWKDTVEFEADGQNVVKILSVTKEDSGSAPGGGSGSAQARGNVQEAIIYQNSRTAAVHVVTAGLEANLLPIPEAKGKKFDAFIALVDQFTDRYYDDAMTVQSTGDLPSREVE